MAPVLPGEAAAVRRGAAVPVDPDPGRPGAARAHQRQVQRPVQRDHAAGRAPVQHRDRAVRQGYRPGGAGLAVHRVAGVYHRVGQVAGQAGDRRGQVARQDQHGQVAGPAHVGVRAEGIGPVPGTGHPQPRGRRRGQPGRQRLGVSGPGGGQHLGGERVHLGAAERDPDVGQVGVHVDRAVPRSVGLAAGRGHARRRQRHQQVTEQITQPVRCLRADDLGHPDRLGQPAAVRDARHRTEPEPLVRRVVQRVPVVGRVDVHDAERPADHRRRGLVDRQPARHVGREAHPQQAVAPGVGVHVGAELDPFGVIPEHRLLGHVQPVQAERGHQPRSRRAPFGPYHGRDRGRAEPWSLGRQVPGTLAVPGVLRVFVLDDQLVAGPGQDAGAGALVGDADRPAARGVRGDQVRGVLDHRPLGLPPRRWPRAGRTRGDDRA